MLSPQDSTAWTRRCLWLLAGVFVFRLLYLFFVIDFDLAGDETYYWDWGRQLAWSYYSKPPLIGWLMRLVGELSDNASWAVRVASITCGTTTAALIFLLARRLYDARTGFYATLMLTLTPANVALNIAFNTDPPLLVFWSAALLFFWRAVENPQRWGWWIALALAIGFGCLAKQMMLVFPLMMLFFLLSSREDRALLREPRLWLSIFAGMAFLLPMMQWQREHGWVTATHMKENFESTPLGFWGWLDQFLRFPILQAATYGFITWIVMVSALIVCVRNWRGAERREKFLVMFSAPALFAFLLLALSQYINENWPAVYYMSAVALGAGVALQRPAWQRWMKRGLWLGGCCLVAAYLYVPVLTYCGGVGVPKWDKLVGARGWKSAGQQAGELLKQVPRPDQTFVLALDHRDNASQMAFHMPKHPRVYRWSKDGHIESQYEIWPSAADKIGQDAFIIYPDAEKNNYAKNPLTIFIKRSFTSVEKMGDITVPLGNGKQRSFQVFLGKNMKQFPASVAQQVEEMKRNGEELALPPKYRTAKAPTAAAPEANPPTPQQ